MLSRTTRLVLTIIAVACLAPPHHALARSSGAFHKQLRSGTTTRGFVGGESHDSYVIHARRGQTLTLQLRWRQTGGNRAELSVSRSPSFSEGEPVRFGKETDHHRRWQGTIPVTGNYYVYVVAHPEAHYTLRAELRSLHGKGTWRRPVSNGIRSDGHK